MTKAELIKIMQDLPDNALITLWHWDYTHIPPSWETVLQPAATQPGNRLILISEPWYILTAQMLNQDSLDNSPKDCRLST